MESRQSAHGLTADTVMAVIVEAVRIMFAAHNPDQKIRQLRQAMGDAAKSLGLNPAEIRQMFDQSKKENKSEKKMEKTILKIRFFHDGTICIIWDKRDDKSCSDGSYEYYCSIEEQYTPGYSSGADKDDWNLEVPVERAEEILRDYQPRLVTKDFSTAVISDNVRDIPELKGLVEEYLY